MRTIAHTRLFVTLTLEEAAAIGRLQPAHRHRGDPRRRQDPQHARAHDRRRHQP
jgi:hypothetical protein